MPIIYHTAVESPRILFFVRRQKLQLSDVRCKGRLKPSAAKAQETLKHAIGVRRGFIRRRLSRASRERYGSNSPRHDLVLRGAKRRIGYWAARLLPTLRVLDRRS